jgi:FecR-like protein
MFSCQSEGVIMNIQRRLVSLVALTLVFGPSLAIAAEGGKDGIGFYTAVLGQATVTHPGEARILPVKLHDEVLFKDVIQTQDESRTRALFQDDSMLTVGENSRVEIDEYIYNPEKNVRLAIVKLMQGQVRALVSKVFKANGSKFEIHTPSAVAAARGTYFTVWVENGQSGIINIGEKGRVDFTSGGMTVAVDPGFFSVAQEGQAPSAPQPHQLAPKGHDQQGAPVKSAEKTTSPPVLIHDQGPKVIHPLEKAELTLASSPAGLTRALVAVELTTLREAPLVELPAQVLQALNLDARLLKTLTTLAGLSSESLGKSGGGTTGATTGTSTTGTLTVGPVSVATTSTSAGTVSVGSVTVAAAAPLAPVTSVLVAPLAPVVSTVLAPVTPLVSTVVAPVVPVITTVVAPVAPVINTVLATPPAVISGALNLLGGH